MRWIVFTGKEFTPRSAHASMSEAMREVAAKWARERTTQTMPSGKRYTMNSGWWWHPQLDQDGDVEWLSMQLGTRDGINWAEVERILEFPSGRIESVCVVREDRYFSKCGPERVEVEAMLANV